MILKPRAGPATWGAKDVLVGPPLTRSSASVLSEAGVLYAITVADGRKYSPCLLPCAFSFAPFRLVQGSRPARTSKLTDFPRRSSHGRRAHPRPRPRGDLDGQVCRSEREGDD